MIFFSLSLLNCIPICSIRDASSLLVSFNIKDFIWNFPVNCIVFSLQGKIKYNKNVSLVTISGMGPSNVTAKRKLNAALSRLSLEFFPVNRNNTNPSHRL